MLIMSRSACSLLGVVFLRSGVVLATVLGLAACDRAPDSPPAAAGRLEPATVYTAREIITMDAERPRAEAIAVVVDRIVAVGTVEEVIASLGERP